MIAIADAGGTRTEWRFLNTSGADIEITQLNTGGFGYTESIDNYTEELERSISHPDQVTELYFYGAGLTGGPFYRSVKERFIELFTNAEIRLESDMLAAARGLCGSQPGYVGVLGTGANFAHFDGQRIKRAIPPLGYILGDEGSGSYLGKIIVRDYLRGKLDEQLHSRLARRIEGSEQEILSRVYSPEGKSFLASLSRFIQQNINHPYTYKLVYDSFTQFFDVFVRGNQLQGTIHFTGSVAFYFSDILRQAGSDFGVSIGNIVETPIAGLTLFHEKDLLK